MKMDVSWDLHCQLNCQLQCYADRFYDCLSLVSLTDLMLDAFYGLFVYAFLMCVEIMVD